MNRLAMKTLILVSLLLSGNAVYAAQRIAVLAFELNDITALPNTPQEQTRTASLQPLLEAAIKKTDKDVEIVRIAPQAQTAANGGLGYLFRFHDLAASLGEQANADWMIVGQHSKPSFLYSYLMVHVINVKSKTLAASIDIELKGNNETVTQHGISSLAKKIRGIIAEW
ncbi:MAG: DUF2380 domain-containing protein [Methylovulum sp.]|nr:DUF2380 domain-containing protein [Methylovulum sp.]